MPIGVALGVLTAVSWGSSDFLARFATRTLGSLRSVFWMQACGAAFITILLFFARDWGHLFDGSGFQPWAWGVLAGAINTAAMFALYRAFELGKMAVVAPISASYPALTVTLSMLSGEKLSLYRGLGIVAAFVGVILVAAGEKPGPQAITGRDVENDSEYAVKQNSLAGIFWAIAA